MSSGSPFTRILVPIDFNDPSRKALSLARDIAAKFGASLDAIHVVDLPESYGMASEGYIPLPMDFREAVHSQVAGQLKQWLERIEVPGGLSQHTVEGRPALEIVRYAKEHDVDLIVMGTHGRSGVPHLLMGSIAERVLRTAPCPVLTVREKSKG